MTAGLGVFGVCPERHLFKNRIVLTSAVITLPSTKLRQIHAHDDSNFDLISSRSNPYPRYRISKLLRQTFNCSTFQSGCELHVVAACCNMVWQITKWLLRGLNDRVEQTRTTRSVVRVCTYRSSERSSESTIPNIVLQCYKIV